MVKKSPSNRMCSIAAKKLNNSKVSKTTKALAGSVLACCDNEKRGDK